MKCDDCQYEFTPKHPVKWLLPKRYWKYTDVIIGIVKRHRNDSQHIVADLKKEGIIAKSTYWPDVKFYKPLQRQLMQSSKEKKAGVSHETER